MVISTEIVDIRRFATPWKLVTYAGMEVARRESAGKAKSGKITKQGSTKQRWIDRIKLLAEIKTAKKFDVSMILFVRNIANGRIWATVISAENLKDFRGITTPLALVDSDSAAEKACKETLEMALQLV
ncbi:MAG: transposase [Thaumarchaeota archaeon]|nr:transposase [Nitrososphaerota archaeon]MDE1831990.1 transposase [Nitrososphaerota archaeon]MDE1878491.1 transposase [Nitrososphaerota archaeon]